MTNAREPASPATVLERFEPLIAANDKKAFIRHGGGSAPQPLLRKTYLKQCPLAVLDKETLKMIQVLRLHRAVDRTRSVTGATVLLRSLVQPGTDLEQIRAKQASLREIASNDGLRRALTDLVHEFSVGENALYKFFNKGLYALFPYRDFKRAKRSAVNMVGALDAIPGTQSAYIGALLSQLRGYRGSPVDQMMNGAIYKTFGGLKSKAQVGVLTPKIRFAPHRFTQWLFAGPMVALAPHILARAGFDQPLSPLMPLIGAVWTGLYAFYGLAFKPMRDTDHFIEPFRQKCIGDSAFNRAVEAVAMIDELLSCHRFAREWPQDVTLPEVTDDAHHRFQATGLRSPVLAGPETDVVPNDVTLNGAKLTFISGPNSGGKTTICKSIVHNQILAQTGAYVLAKHAVINIADMISYQAPKFDGLQDDEGRFGTELSRTRDIFYATSPKSLVILDELAEGTTYEERLHASFGIMSDFHTIGNNTVLVTHNHSLVDRFMDARQGQCLMAEFQGDAPTYRIIPGISRVSHADKVAKKIHFSSDDRRRFLKEKGYL